MGSASSVAKRHRRQAGDGCGWRRRDGHGCSGAAMAGSGWQQLAASAKELAGQSAIKAKAVSTTLGKAVVSAGGAGRRRARCCRGHGACQTASR